MNKQNTTNELRNKEGPCQYCGKVTKARKNHERFCKDNPANKVASEEQTDEQTPFIPPIGETTPEEPQEPAEPSQDHMFRVEFNQDIDPFGYPYRSITQARLKDEAEAEHQANIQTDIVTMTMLTTPYGPCSILIPVEDVEYGKRSLEPFAGNKIFLTKIRDVEYYEILMLRAEVRKMYTNLHSIPTEGGYARFEDIQRNALAITPEGSPTAPPPIMYASQYKNKKYNKTMEKVAQGIEKE